MKKQLFKICIAVALFLTTISCSGQKFFADVPSGEDITKVMIGKGMLRLAGDACDTEMLKDKGISDAIKSIDHLEIITCENKGKIKAVREACQKTVDASGYVIVTEVEDGGDIVHIYMPAEDTGSIVTALILLVEDKDCDEYTAIYLKGKIDTSKLIESGMKDDSSDDDKSNG